MQGEKWIINEMLSGEEEKLYSKRNSLWEQLPPSSAQCITLDMFDISTENIITAATDFPVETK